MAGKSGHGGVDATGRRAKNTTGPLRVGDAERIVRFSPMNRIPVEPTMLTWARERARSDASALNKRFPRPSQEPLPVPDLRTLPYRAVADPGPEVLDTRFVQPTGSGTA
ncbi:MAG: hypothetical protein IPK85_05495 [Gemmatimonadetes bacterium]|nr:hypothetical protein [Gemmatimonadota bacterium]